MSVRLCLFCKSNLKSHDEYKLFCSEDCDKKYDTDRRICYYCGRRLKHGQVKRGNQFCSPNCFYSMGRKPTSMTIIEKKPSEKSVLEDEDQIEDLRGMVKECLEDINAN